MVAIICSWVFLIGGFAVKDSLWFVAAGMFAVAGQIYLLRETTWKVKR